MERKCAYCGDSLHEGRKHICLYVKWTNAKKRITELEGAAAADTDRLKAAAKRAGVQYVGCDTPEHLADEIERLREAKNRDDAYIINLDLRIAELEAEEREWQRGKALVVIENERLRGAVQSALYAAANLGDEVNGVRKILLVALEGE